MASVCSEHTTKDYGINMEKRNVIWQGENGLISIDKVNRHEEIFLANKRLGASPDIKWAFSPRGNGKTSVGWTGKEINEPPILTSKATPILDTCLVKDIIESESFKENVASKYPYYVGELARFICIGHDEAEYGKYTNPYTLLKYDVDYAVVEYFINTNDAGFVVFNEKFTDKTFSEFTVMSEVKPVAGGFVVYEGAHYATKVIPKKDHYIALQMVVTDKAYTKESVEMV